MICFCFLTIGLQIDGIPVVVLNLLVFVAIRFRVKRADILTTYVNNDQCKRGGKHLHLSHHAVTAVFVVESRPDPGCCKPLKNKTHKKREQTTQRCEVTRGARVPVLPSAQSHRARPTAGSKTHTHTHTLLI